MADEDKKVEHINIKVSSADNEVLFRIKKHTPLGKLMNSFCERQGKSLESVRFNYDGKRINKDDTPADLEMEDGDIIDASIEQQGGGDVKPDPGAGSNSTPAQPQGEDGGDTHINIKVSSSDSEVFFRIKRITPLGKLMNTFCDRQGKPHGTYRFFLDGERVEEHATPASLDMDDGDTIEAKLQQTGGH
ncbi:hypothetical protein HDV06_000826 [Boothiomyces sp. JEL0866]|nr:hypothetical protein HDV06_000826 [Boothiomyces sp. JEL0866]